MLLLLFCSDYTVARFGSKRKEFPPLGVLYLAAACEKQGIEVIVRDLAKLNDNEIPETTIIGLSINTSYIYPSFKKRINTLRSKCRFLVVGGQHATIFPKETFMDLGIDYLLVGEGEVSLPMLVKRLYAEKNGTITDIPNVYCSRNINQAKYSESNRIKELDNIPFPARHLLQPSDILLNDRIPGYDIYSTSIITSRGCPYGCQFCGNIYKGFACRSGQNVKEEITYILDEYPVIKGLVFLDENLFYSKRHAEQIINCLSTFKLKWTCNARVDGFTKEIIPNLKGSECVEIKFGIESGSQRILNLMNKQITIEGIEQSLRVTQESGIQTKCFLMFGYPGDDETSASETIAFLKRNKSQIGRVNLFSFAPVPNSPVYRSGICKEFSWEDYKIYNQLTHWWGSSEQFQSLKNGYRMLKEYIDEVYGNE